MADNIKADHIADVHEMVTDTNQASELFELCKEVYRRHQFWAGTDMIFGKEVGRDWRIMPLTLRIPKHNRIPLYTSDYLLEKLPSPLIFDENDCAIEVRRTKKDKYMWSANIRHSYGQYFKQIADTPLKALLKLTIALSEAGELNEQSS